MAPMGKERTNRTSKPIEASEKAPETIGFLEWFVSAVDRNPELKPHHMQAVRAYLASLGLGERETADRYDDGLKKYGF